MSRPSSLHRLLTVATAVSILALIAAPSIALGKDKSEYDASYYDEEIVIVASPYRERVGRTTSGARIEAVFSERVVQSHDLDLRHDADVAELRDRISYGARDACNDVLQQSTGLGVELTTRGECIRDATRQANAEADVLISYKRS